MASNLDRTLAFITLWSRVDLHAVLAEMAPDCIYHNMSWPPLVGAEAIREGLAAFLSGANAIEWRVIHAAENAAGIVLTERLDRFLIGDSWIKMPVNGYVRMAGRQNCALARLFRFGAVPRGHGFAWLTFAPKSAIRFACSLASDRNSPGARFRRTTSIAVALGTI